MPLSSVNIPWGKGVGEVVFYMADVSQRVRVEIPFEVARAIEAVASKSDDECVERVKKHKTRFEQIATRKWDNGDFGIDGSVYVIRIKSGDLRREAA